MSGNSGDLENPDFILTPGEKFERALIAKDKEIKRLKDELEQEIEISKLPIYCRNCDSCGEEGCCPATMCLYGGDNARAREAEILGLKKRITELTDQNRADAHKAMVALSALWPLVSGHPLHKEREKEKVDEAFAALSRIISQP